MSEMLYSPWRLDYILSDKPDGCVFCFDQSEDDNRFVVYRAKHCFVILNAYPYNNGHIMVVPNRHVASLQALSQDEVCELFLTVQLSEKVLKAVYNPGGINIGINLGEAAGAGVAAHMHVHLLPRWQGDTNFMTTVGATRVIPEPFEHTASQLKEQFDKAKGLK